MPIIVRIMGGLLALQRGGRSPARSPTLGVGPARTVSHLRHVRGVPEVSRERAVASVTWQSRFASPSVPAAVELTPTWGGAPRALAPYIERFMGERHPDWPSRTVQTPYDIFPPQIQEVMDRLYRETQGAGTEHAGLGLELADGTVYTYSRALTSNEHSRYSGNGFETARRAVLGYAVAHCRVRPHLANQPIRVFDLHTHPGLKPPHVPLEIPVYHHTDGRLFTLTHHEDIAAALIQLNMITGTLRHYGITGPIELQAGAMPVHLRSDAAHNTYVATFHRRIESEHPHSAISTQTPPTELSMRYPSRLKRFADAVRTRGIIDGRMMAPPDILELSHRYMNDPLGVSPDFLSGYRYSTSIAGQNTTLRLSAPIVRDVDYPGQWEVHAIDRARMLLRSVTVEDRIVTAPIREGAHPFRTQDRFYIETM